MSVNKVILLGRLGKDPELRMTQSQMPVCSFSLATSERRKDQTGNWVEQTEWHNIVVFGRTAENCNSYLKKGREVFIEGSIRTRKWQDKDGRDRWTTEIIGNTVQFVGSRGDSAGGGAYSSGGSSSYAGGAYNNSNGDDFGASPNSANDLLSGIPSADSLGQGSSGTAAGSGFTGGGDSTFTDDDIPF